ncbi:MAG: MATE family efflux transporter [Firmicutes bacterium HGW-Firmicutes-16]|nr:MAG: MATE family efflux transporter [Firmicutes bacterium HGW-Firmicutes-16]
MNEEVKIPENIMGTMSENKLLLKIALPLIFSMLVQALYNVVDSFFVSRISENALTAVSLAFPVQNLMIGFGVGTGIGMNALLSRRLGQKNKPAVDAVAMNGIFLALMNTLIFMIFGIFFARAYFRTQTDIAEIVEMGTAYLSICTIICFGIFFDLAFSRLLQSTGLTKHAMIGQIVGALANIALDYCLILGNFGFPKLGVAGAAYATVIGQILAMIVDLTFNLKRNKEISLKLKGFRPSLKVIGEIYSVGIPAILTTTLFSVFAYGMNRILLGFSTAATAVMGVYIKLQSFIFMPVFGLTSGMIPIVAYNFGAKKPDRIKKTTRLALTYATGIMACGILIFQLAPRTVLSPFIDNPETMEMGVAALKIISLGYIFASVMFVIGSVFQALGHGVHTLILQSVRQLVGALPLAYLFSLTGTVNMVWWALPCAELLTAIASFALYIRVRKRELFAVKEC